MSMLASVIMEGASAMTSVNDLYGEYDFSATAISESSYMTSACATLFSDILEAEQSYMVGDIVGAATIIRESKLGNNVDRVAVAESVFSSARDKIVAAFNKFIAKVKEFYHKVIDWFKAMFSNGENFVKQFGDQIKNKAQKTKGYKYHGYRWDKNKGNNAVTTAQTTITTKMNNLIGSGFSKINDKELSVDELKRSVAASLDAKFSSEDAPNVPEITDKFIHDDLKASDISELKENLQKDYRDGDKEDIEDFSVISVGDMLDFVKGGDKQIQTYEKELKNYEDAVGKTINKLRGLKEEGDGADNKMANAGFIANQINSLLLVYKTVSQVRIDMNKAMVSEWLGALKGFYNYRGTKESADVIEAEDFALLETEDATSKTTPDSDGDDPGENGKGEEATESAVKSILEMAANFKF